MCYCFFGFFFLVSASNETLFCLMSLTFDSKLTLKRVYRVSWLMLCTFVVFAVYQCGRWHGRGASQLGHDCCLLLHQLYHHWFVLPCMSCTIAVLKYGLMSTFFPLSKCSCRCACRLCGLIYLNLDSFSSVLVCKLYLLVVFLNVDFVTASEASIFWLMSVIILLCKRRGTKTLQKFCSHWILSGYGLFWEHLLNSNISVWWMVVHWQWSCDGTRRMWPCALFPAEGFFCRSGKVALVLDGCVMCL